MSKLAQFRDFGKKIICVGRNYRPTRTSYGSVESLQTCVVWPHDETLSKDILHGTVEVEEEEVRGKEHAAELGNAVPSKPILFLKPSTAYIIEGQAIKIPKGCSDLNHEVELGIVIGTRATNVQESEAMKYVGGYALGLDMTARDWQSEAKKNGHPWSLAKGFDTSCPVSAFIEKEKVPDPGNLDIWLKVNGEIRQSGNTKDMIFSVEHLISYTSQFFTLEPGDLLLTGTPSGVSKLNPGDIIQAGLGDLVKIQFKVES